MNYKAATFNLLRNIKRGDRPRKIPKTSAIQKIPTDSKYAEHNLLFGELHHLLLSFRVPLRSNPQEYKMLM